MMRRFFENIAAFIFASVFFTGVSLAQEPLAQGIAQNATDFSQSLVPLEVYVGDVAEIRYNFRSAVDYFSDTVIDTEIDSDNFPFASLENILTVRSAHFSRNDMEYSFVMQIIPWRPGVVEFPPFDLFSVLNFSESEKNKNISYMVVLEPIEIKSIVEKTGKGEIQPSMAPIVIPGTSYVIFALILGAIVVFILILRMLLRIGDIRRGLNNLKIRYAYRRNSIIALRKIKRLLRTANTSDIDFCADLQNITRNYLSFRFDYPFKSVSAIGVREAFRKICLGEIPNAIAYSVEDLTSMFVRTDYIRYAHDSLDSMRQPQSVHEARLAANERKSLAEMVIKAINIFESDGRDEEERNVI